MTSISRRLQSKLDDDAALGSAEEDLAEDYEALDETEDEWTEDDKPEPLTAADRKAIEAEIADLTEFAKLATSIDQNGKGKALLKALGVAFAKAEELGAAKKAIIFTEFAPHAGVPPAGVGRQPLCRRHCPVQRH